MILVPRKAIWTQQPQQLVDVDWENPLSRGLVRVDNFARRGQDVLGGPAWNTTQFASSQRGIALEQTDASDKVCYSPGLHTRLIAGMTVLSLVWRSGPPTASEFFVCHGTGTSYNWGLYDSPSTRYVFLKNTGGTNKSVSFAYASGGWATVVAAYSGAGGYVRLYQDGVKRSETAQSGNVQQNDYHLSSFAYASGSGNYLQPLIAIWNRELSADEVKRVSANPWQIFRRPSERLWIPVSSGVPAGATLEAHAQAEATATGNLTLSATLDGLALAVASASGNLTTQIPLAGAAVSIVSASGDLLTGINLSAAAIAQATAAGNLTAQIRLDGAALAQAAASAGLTSAILLEGHAAAAATASADLTTGSDGLEAHAHAQAAASADLTAQIRLEAHATAEATASGTLAADAGSLAANAQAQTTVIATLTTSIRLSGTAAAQAGASGILTTSIPLTAAALANAIATGTLSTAILLSGHAEAQASASGILTDATEPAPAVPYRINTRVRHATRLACRAERLAPLIHRSRRLTPITHQVTHV